MTDARRNGERKRRERRGQHLTRRPRRWQRERIDSFRPDGLPMRSFPMWLRVVGWSRGVELKRNTTAEAGRGAVRANDFDSRTMIPEHHFYHMATSTAEAAGVAVCGGRNEARMKSGTLCQPVGRANRPRRQAQWIGMLPRSGWLHMRQPHQTRVSGGVGI